MSDPQRTAILDVINTVSTVHLQGKFKAVKLSFTALLINNIPYEFSDKSYFRTRFF
jgi:hypothetical protein